MKKQDYIFISAIILIILPFAISDTIYHSYKIFNTQNGMTISFIKFGVLATLGEILGLRIMTGNYTRKGFGIFPRAIIWGILGMGINIAMIVFSKGIPHFFEYMGMDNSTQIMKASLSISKVMLALSISVAMNLIFAPVFMTFHKITDMHILNCSGSIRSLITPIPMTKIITGLNWDTQWNFVFKKTIPFFWIPAHTITFLLPEEIRVLFAALLGVALGILLAIAARMK